MRRYIDDDDDSGKRKKRKIEVGEFGLIESIILQNFMCHDHLEFKLEPHVNFIIGKNGSGKSAVLTAIILALGGKSSSTGRYSSLKGFIKTGKTKAKIIITLKNDGINPYKPQDYGKKIIVEREIKADGSGSYKLKSAAGTIVSSQKEELLKIVNEMDIQVENPVTVLTQETSRNFLHSRQGSAEKLYSFFFLGSGLKALENSYLKVSALKDESHNEFERKSQALPQLEKDMKQLRKYLDCAAKVTDYQHELVWARVIQVENILQEKENQSSKKKKEVAIIEREIQKCEVSHQERTVEFVEIEKQKNEVEKKISSIKTSLQQVKTEHDSANEKLKASMNILEINRRYQQKLVKSIEALKNNIEEIERNPSNINEEKNKREDEIKKSHQDIVLIRTSIKSLEQEKREKLEEQENLRIQIDTCISEINSFKYQLKNLEEQHAHYENKTRNKMNAFGTNTNNILEDIKNQIGSFKQKPIGPIGNFIEVRDEKWIPAVEKCLSTNLLKSFCCDNHQDATKLKNIMKKYEKYGPMPSIITSPFLTSVHNISSFKVRSNYPTVLDMLSISNVVVANCLIDQVKIESRLLIEDLTEAQNYLMSTPPQYCISAYLLNCTEICLNPYRCYPNPRNMRNISVLGTVNMERIRHLKQEMIEFEENSKAKEQAKRELSSLKCQLTQTMNSTDRKILSLKKTEREIDEKIRDLKCYEEPKDVSCIMEELDQMKRDLMTKKEEAKNCEVDVSKHKAEFTKLNSTYSSLYNVLKEERKKYTQLADRLKDCEKEKETLKLAKRNFERELTKSITDLKSLDAVVMKEKEQSEEVLKAAEKVCPRVETDKSVEMLKKQLEETNKLVRQESNSTREELHAKFKEKVELLKTARQDIARIKTTLHKLDNMYKLRKNNYGKIEYLTEEVVNTNFTQFIAGNSYKGSITFNNKAKTLKINVNPRSDSNNVKHSTGVLSGGEKSYTTVCFLIAMWDRVKSPFKVLDEYDVFMDSNNRKLSLDLMIGKAEEMRDTQFIFLSPLELPQMKESPFIKVHQMPSIERVGLS